jgi:protein involved in polysaccharide export with SLBB domain
MQYIHKLRFISAIAAAFAALLTALAFAQTGEATQTYSLGAGDVILIDVFGEADLTMEVMLADTGVINYPFLGELSVAGVTVREFEEILVAGLKGPYLIEPDITVSVIQYRNVYITGEVAKPGGYPYQPGLTVEKAVALAGGFTERASRSKIDVKSVGDSEQEASRVRISDAIRPGDIVTIHQSFF